MERSTSHRRTLARRLLGRTGALLLSAGLVGAAGCASASGGPAATDEAVAPAARTAPTGDPRVGLEAGLLDAGEATWNLNVVSETPPPEDFVGKTNSDLAFKDHYAIQGNYNGFQIWDISDPSEPSLVVGYVCPASQSDVSVYGNLLFVSAEGLGSRLDCGTQGVKEQVSADRIRGIRIFDISDIEHPKYVSNVQTCRGSHTHSVLVDPDDPENVYVYISGQAPVRPAEELAGCSGASPSEDPNTALFRIEVIRVPLANPEKAAIVSSPRIFENLVAPPQHGLAPEDKAELERARARGAFVFDMGGRSIILPDRYADQMLDSIVRERGGEGAPTGADSAALRARFEKMIAERMGEQGDGPQPGPNQCHDITLYPAIQRAGGACAGYGLLLDIRDPIHPRRLAAVSDSNFSYWHSATFSNDGSKILFTDEWGGGGQPKCRASDPKEWGADAIFTVENGKMRFRSYYKLPAAQTSEENCVAHNGSLIPVPGRDIMVQAWYQGGVSVFDWTDPDHPKEIAFFDRGPVNAETMEMGGSWSAYWYNGVIVSSEIARGLDILELAPSEYLTANEIAAARSAKLDYLNVQGQPRYTWPATYSLARSYLDQLERSGGLPAAEIAASRRELARAEVASEPVRAETLAALAERLEGRASGHAAPKVERLAEAVRELSNAGAPRTAASR